MAVRKQNRKARENLETVPDARNFQPAVSARIEPTKKTRDNPQQFSTTDRQGPEM